MPERPASDFGARLIRGAILPPLRKVFLAILIARPVAEVRDLAHIHTQGCEISPTGVYDGGPAPAAAKQVSPDMEKRSEAYAALDSVPDAILVVARDGRVVFANQHAGRLFAYEPGQLVGVEIEALIPGRYRQRHAARVAASPPRRSRSS